MAAKKTKQTATAEAKKEAEVLQEQELSSAVATEEEINEVDGEPIYHANEETEE